MDRLRNYFTMGETLQECHHSTRDSVAFSKATHAKFRNNVSLTLYLVQRLCVDCRLIIARLTQFSVLFAVPLKSSNAENQRVLQTSIGGLPIT